MSIRSPFLEATASLPSRFQQYIDIRGDFGQVVQFMAVVEGIKPVLDDWVAVERLPAFLQLATCFGLIAEIDSFFAFINNVAATKGVIGADRLNTTRAHGYQPDSHPRSGYAHVFLARDRMWLSKAVASGWYTLVVDERVLEKPWIDHYHFGECLGYPACCRRFFAFHNEWNTDNSYYQAQRVTPSPSFLCNTLPKNSGLSYAVHIPCSFACPGTADYAAQVRMVVSAESSSLVAQIDTLLQQPYLVLSEWEIYGLVGAAEAGECIKYRDVFVVPTNHPDLVLYRALLNGDSVEVERDVIRIYKGARVHATYQARSDRFGPQMPLLIKFS